MNELYTERADAGYQRAERKAEEYFTSLYKQVTEKTYVSALTEDFHLWKRNHIHRPAWLSLFSRKNNKPDSKDYHRYISWLNYTGKLDDYLERSVSYIYMRDLGKALDSAHTQTRIQRVIDDVKKLLLRSNDASHGFQPDFISLSGMYRWAQKEGVESAAIWVIHKLNQVAIHIPKEMNAEHAQRKLIKIMIGVIMHAIEEMDEDTTAIERARRLDAAIRLGYSYGLTYPFIDDLLDSGALDAEEKKQYTSLIRRALLTGTVPEPGEWSGSNSETMQYIHSELSEAFECIKAYQEPEMQQTFFELSYMFFHSQELDRDKELSHADYTNEELYIPVILKSAASRLIVRSVISAPEDEGFDQRSFYYGIYNQLADDFADMFEDMREGAVTPYTYYLKYRDSRPDLINPFELYWAVISNLIHNVYHNDAKTREVILDRAINGLKRCKARLGLAKYTEVMDIFASGNPAFYRLVEQMVTKAEDVDFLDKLLRDQMVNVLINDRKEKEYFAETVNNVREQINNLMRITKTSGMAPIQESLIDAANYSLEGDGKRLRPILAWVMGVNEYGLSASAIEPLLRSLEYMHTASLIFDDLPTQDNASSRRGRPTLHQVHNSATAELTGLFLIQKAIQEQASLQKFDPETVLELIRYSSQKAGEMCMGQEMDLHSRGKALTLEQLNRMCFYKTGIAFEASLVMPAILAQVKETEIEILKKYAYHAGIAFQIRDDLLDFEGDTNLLGKPVGKDAQNNNSTFVSILGVEGAKQEMWEHYCLAMESLQKMPRSPVFLRHLLTYIVSRNS